MKIEKEGEGGSKRDRGREKVFVCVRERKREKTDRGRNID